MNPIVDLESELMNNSHIFFENFTCHYYVFTLRIFPVPVYKIMSSLNDRPYLTIIQIFHCFWKDTLQNSFH